ncbi:MAG TPA: glycosyltransferase family 4 protein [Chthoniobacterales bacterium]
MKIAYLTTYDASDANAWSGSGNYILRTLRDNGFQIECVGNLREKNVFPLKVKQAFYAFVFGKKYRIDREPAILKDYAAQFEKRLAAVDYDMAFSPGTIPLAYLKTEKPMAFWTDATFASMIDFYPQFTNLCNETIRSGNWMEQLALSKCRVAIYSSEWAANTAIRNYDVDPAKVKVVPFGANIICNRSFGDISKIIDDKSFDVCKLLFLGVDWQRKGGDKALAVAELLTKRGIKTELHVAGCDPPAGLPGFVKLHGFISKNTEEGNKQLERLMSDSHFLILPSRAECYGVVFAEASSFGLPSLATNVGGIPAVVRDGINGQTFPLDEDPEKYCDYIERYLSSKQEYAELALSSFKEYSTRLNWASAGRRARDLILSFCS